MIMENIQRRYGSLIKVKPEYEERYIILHKHAFPGVLKQIHDSGIRNYSIFLREGILFSYFEYVGEDFAGDMERMGQDETTREWWKLTDPMQEPFETRKEGEWWASLDEIFHFGHKQVPSYQARKLAYVAQAQEIERQISLPGEFEGLLLQNLSVYFKDNRLYLYLEDADKVSARQPERCQAALQAVLHLLVPTNGGERWHAMREVFHTD
jgi:L-rhamnose mutarotase